MHDMSAPRVWRRLPPGLPPGPNALISFKEGSKPGLFRDAAPAGAYVGIQREFAEQPQPRHGSA